LGTILAIVLLMRIQTPGASEVRGTVSSAWGGALKDVVVTSMPTAEDTTNASGEFALLQPGELVRFSLPGFRPRTVRTEELRKNPAVVLRVDPNAQWNPPTCPANQSGRLISGGEMQFIVGPGVRVRRGQDIDYQTHIVCIRKSCMQHGVGPLWSFGMPPWRYLDDGVAEIQERDVQWQPDRRVHGSEYRRTHPDGTYTRWVGVFGETIAYEHAPKQAAERFDQIIDSLCWRKP
jgi:hypothetical protein